jgi:hypothetical protein
MKSLIWVAVQTRVRRGGEGRQETEKTDVYVTTCTMSGTMDGS